MVWPRPCPVSDSPPTGPSLTLLIKHDLDAPVYILPPSTRPDSCNGHRKVSNALPESDRNCPHSGMSPSSRACLGLLPVLQLSCTAVCAATELSVRCSQDPSDLRTISVPSRPARRTSCNSELRGLPFHGIWGTESEHTGWPVQGQSLTQIL